MGIPIGSFDIDLAHLPFGKFLMDENSRRDKARASHISSSYEVFLLLEGSGMGGQVSFILTLRDILLLYENSSFLE